MIKRKLLQTILSGGIQRTNFFNGRILTRDDMKKEQEACIETNKRTNKAAGEGVVHGLEVRSVGTENDPVVSVEPGMAISRSGSTLYLGLKEEISVIPQKEDVILKKLIFSDCATKTEFPTGFGVYIFIISPVSDYEGFISTNNMLASGGSSNCGRKYITQGIQFNLVKVNPSFISRSSLSSKLAQFLDLTTEKDKHKTRNLLAHLCFGTQEKKEFHRDPFFENKESINIRDSNYGLIEAMRNEGSLKDEDVPLAMLYWTKDKLSIFDMWSARRKIVRKTPAGNWHLFLGERNTAESEACFLQFQSQIDDIIKNKKNVLDSISAMQYFSFLPSLGTIPVQRSYIQSYMREKGNIEIPFNDKTGFHPPTFFAGMKYREPVLIEGAKFEAAMRGSLSYLPVDTESGEFLWLYFIRENMESVLGGNGKPYLIFASGHMPYIGDARYDLSHLDFSNYSSGND